MKILTAIRIPKVTGTHFSAGRYTITSSYLKFPKSAQKPHFKTVMIIVIDIQIFLTIVHTNTHLFL